MKYFKNTELAKLYHVSEKSVRNWIEAAEAGKLDLQLYEKDDRKFIANITKNISTIEKLVEKGKKFKNTRGLKTLVPDPEFYKIFDKKQILDIIANLSIHKELPLQYGYLDGGAESWDNYSHRLISEESPNFLNQTLELVDLQAPYIDQLLGNRRVNVVDLGPGNGLPMRPTITRLLSTNRLNKYIAIDISKDILTILEKNIHVWFDGQVKMESYVRNFTEERFDDVLLDDRLHNSDDVINLVFVLGGTISNTRLRDHALRVINSSLGPKDLLIHNGYLDTPYARRYFDLSGTSISQQDLSKGKNTVGVRQRVPKLLHMDETVCESEVAFSEKEKSRFQWLKPKVDLVIKFKVGDETCDVELYKDEPILLWRHRHYTFTGILDFFGKSDFDVEQICKSRDGNYFLTISKIKTGVTNVG